MTIRQRNFKGDLYKVDKAVITFSEKGYPKNLNGISIYSSAYISQLINCFMPREAYGKKDISIKDEMCDLIKLHSIGNYSKYGTSYVFHIYKLTNVDGKYKLVNIDAKRISKNLLEKFQQDGILKFIKKVKIKEDAN